MAEVISKDFSAALERIAARYEATPAQLKQASTRALKKTFRYLSDRVSRDVAKRAGIGLKVVRGRARTGLLKEGAGARLWLGLQPFRLENLGNMSQSRTGVRVRSLSFDGGFLASLHRGKEQAYIRPSRAKALGTPLVNFGKRKSSVKPMQDDGRFPVRVLGVDIEDDMLAVVEQYLPKLNDVFEKRLTEEIEYAIKN